MTLLTTVSLLALVRLTILLLITIQRYPAEILLGSYLRELEFRV